MGGEARKGERWREEDGEGSGEVASALSDDAGEVENLKNNRFGGSGGKGGGGGSEFGELRGGGAPGGAAAEEEGELDLHVAF